MKHDTAAGNFARGCDEAHDRQRGYRFTGTGFADNANRLPAIECEIDVIDRRHFPMISGKYCSQTFYR